MIRLLQWLILGHIHEWDMPDTSGALRKKGHDLPVGHYRDCRCKKCGVWRRFTT